MSRRSEFDGPDDIAAELERLDRELSELTLAERPSFGPELRNELARQWPRARRHRGVRVRRYAAAAAVAGVALAGVLVPPVRAAVRDGVQRILEVTRPEGGILDEMEVVVVPLPDRGVPETRAGVVAIQSGEEADDAPGESASPEPGQAPRMPAFQPGTSTPPRVMDATTARATVQRFYPESLQSARIGGTASVLLWVREDGSVSSAEVARGTGLDALDLAARSAAASLRFEPARRNGVPVGTWVEFDIVFDPSPANGEGRGAELGALSGQAPVEARADDDRATLYATGDAAATVRLTRQRVEALNRLQGALSAQPGVVDSEYGPLENILQGTPPQGADPTRWRRRVARALTAARIRDPENPVPYLALARIRRNEGRWSAAEDLIRQAEVRAVRGEDGGSPFLRAELAREAGWLARRGWLAWRGLVAFHPPADVEAACPASTTSWSADGITEVVQDWNLRCPGTLVSSLVAGSGVVARAEGLRREALRRFTAAVEARPEDPDANRELLLLLAEAHEWEALLVGARRFVDRADRHPHGLLMEGLALARIGAPADAESRFREALEQLPDRVRQAFNRPGPIEGVGPQGGEGPSRAVDRFGAGSPGPLEDPILSTPVNERLVEHWARSSYAWLRFGALDGDAAAMWVRFGEPQGVRSVAAEAGIRLEFWSYGPRPALAFVRAPDSAAVVLTPESRHFLRRWTDTGVALEGYGRALPAADRLDAELVETAAAMGNGTDLQIRFSLSDEEAGSGTPTGRVGTENPEPLRVGVFLLGFDGTPVRVERWEVERGAGTVELTVPMDTQVREAVVEVLDPVSGQVSAARTPIRLTVTGGSVP